MWIEGQTRIADFLTILVSPLAFLFVQKAMDTFSPQQAEKHQQAMTTKVQLSWQSKVLQLKNEKKMCTHFLRIILK